MVTYSSSTGRQSSCEWSGSRIISATTWRNLLIGTALAGATVLVVISTLTASAIGVSHELLRRSDRHLLGRAYDWLRVAGVNFEMASLAVHFSLFLLLGIVSSIATLATPGSIAIRRYAITGVFLAVGAAGTEIGQHWVSGRSPDTGDLVADLLGAGIGLIVPVLVTRSSFGAILRR